MLELTKKERNAIYKKALVFYLYDIDGDGDGVLGGLCFYLRRSWRSININCPFVEEEEIKIYFPEIWKHRPESRYSRDFWWNRERTKRRIFTLESAIKETEGV